MKKVIIVVLTMCLTHVVYGQETKKRDILSNEKNLLSENVADKVISDEKNKCFRNGKQQKSFIESDYIPIDINGIQYFVKIFVVCTREDDRCIIDGNIILYDEYMTPIDRGTYHIEHGPNGWELGCGGHCFPHHLGIPVDIFLTFWQYVDSLNECCEEEAVVVLSSVKTSEIDSQCQEFKIEGGASIKELSNSTLKVLLSPNPVKDILYITPQEEITDMEVIIYDMFGRVLLQSKQQYEIPLQILAKGLYLIKITTPLKVGVYKMLKE